MKKMIILVLTFSAMLLRAGQYEQSAFLEVAKSVPKKNATSSPIYNLAVAMYNALSKDDQGKVQEQQVYKNLLNKIESTSIPAVTVGEVVIKTSGSAGEKFAAIFGGEVGQKVDPADAKIGKNALEAVKSDAKYGQAALKAARQAIEKYIQ